MADLEHAYQTIINHKKNIQPISYFFTQRKISETTEAYNNNMEIITKDINYTQNYVAIVIPKRDNNLPLIIEIHGDNGYEYTGKITSYTQNNPDLLIPLQDDKQIFVKITFDSIDGMNDHPGFKTFIHIPSRYRNNDDIDDNKNKNYKKTIKVDL